MQQDWRLSLHARLLRLAALAGLWLGFGPLAQAEEANPGGSPLDTVMHTKIWAEVPEAKDFVRETRPPPHSLAYQPVTGTDPERPKLKTKAELDDLESELGRAAAHNDGNARKHFGIKKPVAAKTVKRE